MRKSHEMKHKNVDTLHPVIATSIYIVNYASNHITTLVGFPIGQLESENWCLFSKKTALWQESSKLFESYSA